VRLCCAGVFFFFFFGKEAGKNFVGEKRSVFAIEVSCSETL
jgi:hypothetical protein